MRFEWQADTMGERILFCDPDADGTKGWSEWVMAWFTMSDWGHESGAQVEYINEIRWLAYVASGLQTNEWEKRRRRWNPIRRNDRPLRFDDETMTVYADGWSGPYKGDFGKFSRRDFYEFVKDRYFAAMVKEGK